jgi:hypothetical protein
VCNQIGCVGVFPVFVRVLVLSVGFSFKLSGVRQQGQQRSCQVHQRMWCSKGSFRRPHCCWQVGDLQVGRETLRVLSRAFNSPSSAVCVMVGSLSPGEWCKPRRLMHLCRNEPVDILIRGGRLPFRG